MANPRARNDVQHSIQNAAAGAKYGDEDQLLAVDHRSGGDLHRCLDGHVVGRDVAQRFVGLVHRLELVLGAGLLVDVGVILAR